MTTTKKINLSIIIFVVLISLLISFVIYPSLKEIKKNSKELIYQKENLSNLESKIANLEKFKVLYKSLEEILDKIDNLFIDPEVPMDFISFLEENSKDCQLTTEISFLPAKRTETDPWPFLLFKITSIGSFSNFLKFLEKLENSKYLIEIQNLSINQTKKSETSSKADIQANLSIKVYSR